MDPSWTDITQAIAALIAIPGAIAGFWVLFRRDRERELEIRSLSTIADNLVKMQEENEKRYRASRKPFISITIEHLQENKKIRLDFRNNNPNCTITKYKAKVHLDDFNLVTMTINQNGSEQLFSVGISYKVKPPDATVLQMDYETEEGYEFIQDITVWWDRDHYVYSPGPLIDKNNAYASGN